MMVRTSCPTRQSSRPVSEVHVCFQAPLQDRRLFIFLLFLLQIIANYQQQASRRSPAVLVVQEGLASCLKVARLSAAFKFSST